MTRNTPGPVDLLELLARHRRKMLVVAACVLAVAAGIIFFGTRTYRSESKLFVRVGREAVSLDPTAATDQSVSLSRDEENQLNSVVEILRSRGLAEKVVERLGPDFVLNGPSDGESEASGGWLPSLNLDPISDREAALIALQDHLNIYSPKRSRIVEISWIAESPKHAQAVVSTVTDVFHEEHLRLNRSEESYPFFESQVDALHKKLATAQDQLRDAKNESGVLTIEGKQKVLDDQIAAVRTKQLERQAQLEASQAKLKEISAELETLPKTVVSQTVSGLPHQAFDIMRGQLYELQIRENDLQAKYKETHPALIAVRQQRAELEGILKGQAEERTQETDSINPHYQALNQVLLDEQAQIASLRAEIAAFDGQLEHLNEKLKSLNEEEVRISELTRQIEVAEAKYRTYVDKLEQARVDDALAQQAISSVEIVHPATLAEKPISPKKGLVAIFGVVGAFFSAIAVALLADYYAGMKTATTTSVAASEPLVTEGRRNGAVLSHA